MNIWKVILVAVITAVVTSVACFMVIPLFFGRSPIDVIRGRTGGEISEMTPAEQRVIFTGQADVVSVAQKNLPTVVNLEVQFLRGTAIGSGFIISSDGYIVTNNHVVQDSRGIKVSLADGRVLNARIVGLDAETDLAVIKVDANGLPVAELGTSSDLVVGELAVAIGSPEGFEQTVTSGIISALHRNLPDFHPDNAPLTTPLLDVIQTDAAINPGNSGGPLCNGEGKVIGINTAIASQSGGNIGIGFAIPIDNAAPVISDLIKTGKVVHPWMGISGTTLSPDIAIRYNLPVQEGALVRTVYRDGPADRAGMKMGDIIVALDGKKTKSMDEVMLEIRRRQVGERVKVSFYRGMEIKETEVILEAKPSL